MKKRLFAAVTVLVMSVLAAFCMLGCESGGSDSLRTYSSLKMKEKYVRLDRDSSTQASYTFYSNGTGEYDYFYKYHRFCYLFLVFNFFNFIYFAFHVVTYIYSLRG